MIGTYNYWLVALSVLVAIFASYTALDLARRSTATRGGESRAWLLGGAFSMGIGIWSMHFIGMLAFSSPVAMSYDVPVILLSLLFAVLVSGLALYTVSREQLSWGSLLLGGVLMGFGICAMQYTGMAAMEMSPSIRDEPWLFAAAVVIAIVASHVALFIAFTLRGDAPWAAYAKVGSAVIMGFAITGMHYTGMAAARHSPDSIYPSGAAVDNTWMAITLGGVTIVILCITLALSVIDARRASKTAAMPVLLKRPRLRECLVRGILDLAHQYYELVAAEARDRVFAPTRHAVTRKLTAGDMTERFGHLRAVHDSTRTIRPAKKLAAALAAD